MDGREIRNRSQAAALSLIERERWRQALEVLSLMRRDVLTLAEAAERLGTTPESVRRYVGRAIRKDSSTGLELATERDRLYRPMQFLTPRGLKLLEVTDSGTASEIARYWQAVQHYLASGATDRLEPFRGRSIRVGKVAYPFITDRGTLERLAHAGEVRFEDLYGDTAP